MSSAQPADGLQDQSHKRPRKRPRTQDDDEKQPHLDREPSLKKRKATNGLAPQAPGMEFQTPHPTLEAQSQVYKLPSSSPMPSPGPLSPVPNVKVAATSRKAQGNSSKRTKSFAGPNAVSTPRSLVSPAEFASITLTSGQLPQILTSRRSRSSRKRGPSRSNSCSSSASNSTNSSRANSKDPYSHATRQFERSNRPAKLKHAQSLSALDNNPAKVQNNGKATKEMSKTNITHKYSTKSKHKSKAHGQGKAFTLLASPFVSRASSPVNSQNMDTAGTQAHIAAANPNSKLKELHSDAVDPPLALLKNKGLSDTFFDPNVPSTIPPRRNRSNRKGAKTSSQAVMALNAPDSDGRNNNRNDSNTKQSARRKSAKGSENRTQGELQRSHAPTRTQRLDARASESKAFVKADDDDTKFLPNPLPRTGAVTGESENTGAIRSRARPSTGPGPALRPAASMQDLHAPSNLAHGARHFPHLNVEDNPHTAWMHARSGVDFDRPPSQLDLNIAAAHDGLDFMRYGYMDFDDTFLYSSSSEDEDEHAGERNKRGRGGRVGYGFGFGDHVQAEGGTLGAPFSFGGDLELDEERFAEDPWGISTPFKVNGGSEVLGDLKNNARMNEKNLPRPEVTDSKVDKVSPAPQSIPSFENIGPTMLSRSSSSRVAHVEEQDISAKKDQDIMVDEDECDDGEETMDLTESAHTRHNHLDQSKLRAGEDDDEEDGREAGISWITDSLISAPTAYLRQKARMEGHNEEVAEARGDEDAEPAQIQDEEYEDEEYQTAQDLSVATLSSEISRPSSLLRPSSAKQVSPDNIQANGNTSASTTAKRTRSGTIVPANSVVLTGARRTRSGTIVGPLPVPPSPNGDVMAGKRGNMTVGSGPTKRTRSGTIVASGSISGLPTVTDSGVGLSISGKHGRARSGSMLRVPKAALQTLSIESVEEGGADADDAAIGSVETRSSETGRGTEGGVDVNEALDDVGGYADSLYTPIIPGSGDTDPLNIMSFAEGEEGEEWGIVSEPPSPEIAKTKRERSKSIRDFAASASRWLKAKASVVKGSEGGENGKGKRKARFVGGDEDAEESSALRDGTGAKDKVVAESSDDELLLIPGQTIRLFR